MGGRSVLQLTNEVQADVVIHKAVGSDVTLVPKFTGSPSKINWKVDGNKLVEMELSPPRRKFYRLQDRATIDEKDGRLTITKLIIGDTGQYKAEVLVNNNINYTTINLIVLVEADDVIHKAVGSDVTLVPKFTGSPSEINWKVDGNKLVEMELSPYRRRFYRLEDRATIDEKDGRLTITKLIIGDTGQYKAEVLVNNNINYTTINLIVLECPASPTIRNRTINKNTLELHCDSATPNVSYQWMEMTRILSNHQSYNITHTKEDVPLTCVVSNEACERNSTVIIPLIAGTWSHWGHLLSPGVVCVLYTALLICMLNDLRKMKNERNRSDRRTRRRDQTDIEMEPTYYNERN